MNMSPTQPADRNNPVPVNPVPINIVMVQDVFQVGDIKSNADKIIELTVKASLQGADLVVFPELALVGYPPEDLLYREDFLKQADEACLRIQHTLKENIGDTGVVFGLPLKRQPSVPSSSITNKKYAELYNAAVYLHKGEIVARCYKQSLPNYSVFDEVRYFIAGTESTIIEVKGHKLGLLICEDVWQRDIVERSKKMGAEALIVLNASPFHVNKHEERVDILKCHAGQFDLPILYLNMTGGQDELVFDGDSLVVNRQAELIARGRLFESDTLALVFDGDDVFTHAPFSDAMLQAPSSDEVTYKALVTGVRDFVHQNGFTGVVIGLSGGVDSALTHLHPPAFQFAKPSHACYFNPKMGTPPLRGYHTTPVHQIR